MSDPTPALTPEQIATTRDALAAKHGVSDADRDLLMSGTDEATLAAQAERLGRARLLAGNTAPREGANPELRGSDRDLRQFARDLFGSPD